MQFKRVHDAPMRRISVTVDGSPFEAQAGDTVAAVLLVAGGGPTRVSNATGTPRAPYCMMGVCFECLVTIDGVGNRQGCLVPVVDGMRIERQTARREAGR
jgi:predicted molibdopterin-dependent oxidoreductase YjgC